MKRTETMDQVSYCLGLSIASNLISLKVKNINTEALYDAMNRAFAGEIPKITPVEADNILKEYFNNLLDEKGLSARVEGAKFLIENRAKDGITTLPSGLQYKILKNGDGAKPQASDSVKCHYEGRLIDGTVFDSSIERGEPAEFFLNQVIPGWTEALQLMPTGSKWELYIPSDLAYGVDGAGPSIGPNETLIFNVELLEIV